MKTSEGLLEATTDMVLFFTFLTIFSIGQSPTSKGTGRAIFETEQFLSEFNYQSIKQVLANLKRKGYLVYKPRDVKKTLKVTEEGKKRITEILPSYKTKRSWDGKIYLVTYDIPEKRRQDRDMLRDYLKRIGAGQLQASVYLTPFNPRFILKKFIGERQLQAGVIISDLGEGAVIGEEDLESLIKKVYYLDKLENNYLEFIEKYRNEESSPTEVIFSFLNILKSDPQLPFELLSPNWPSNKAYEIYRKNQGPVF